jgi:hypothetical protein
LTTKKATSATSISKFSKSTEFSNSSKKATLTMTACFQKSKNSKTSMKSC